MRHPSRFLLVVSLAAFVLVIGASGCGGGGGGGGDGIVPPPSTPSLKLSAGSPAGQLAPEIAYDSTGNAVAVWIEKYGQSSWILWSRYTATTSTWSAPAEWDGVQSDAVAVASNGTSFLVAWNAACRIRAAVSEGETWSSSVQLSPACTTDTSILAASDGSGYAVAWTEYVGSRRVLFANVFDGTSWQEDSGGNVAPVPLSSSDREAIRFGMAASAGGYGVAWLQHGPSGDAGVYVNVFEEGGWQEDLDGAPAPVRLGSMSRWGPRPAIASDGEGYAVVWAGRDTGGDDVLASMRSGGAWTAPASIEQEITAAWAPAVASNGSGYAAVWLRSTDTGPELRASVFAGGGWLAEAAVVAVAREDSEPAVIASGAGYLAAWLARGNAEEACSSRYGGGAWGAPERLDAGSGRVRPVRLSPAGLGSAAIFPQDDAEGANGIFVARRVGEAWAGAQNLLASSRRSTAWGARLVTNRLGETLALWTQYRNGVPEVVARLHRAGAWQPVEVVAPDARQAALATDGTGFLVAWASDVDGFVRARQWTNGSWSETERVSPLGNAALPVVAASDGRGYGVAWSATTGTWTIEMARFDGTSWEEDGEGATLATRVDVDGSAMSPTIASNGVGYCVAWSSYAGGGPLALARIHDGSSWQPAPATLNTAGLAYPVVIASDGGGYAAAWAQWDGGVRNVYANVFDGTSWQEDGGAPAPALIEELDGSAGPPVIASNGRGYAVAWIQQDSSGEPSSVRANVFDGASWQVEGGHPAPARLDDAPSIPFGGVVLASDRAGYAAAWGEYDRPEAILLSRFDGTGWQSNASAPEPTVIDTGAGLGAFPECITSNGRGYSLIWQEPDRPWQWATPDIWARLGI